MRRRYGKQASIFHPYFDHRTVILEKTDWSRTMRTRSIDMAFYQADLQLRYESGEIIVYSRVSRTENTKRRESSNNEW